MYSKRDYRINFFTHDKISTTTFFYNQLPDCPKVQIPRGQASMIINHSVCVNSDIVKWTYDNFGPCCLVNERDKNWVFMTVMFKSDVVRELYRKVYFAFSSDEYATFFALKWC